MTSLYKYCSNQFLKGTNLTEFHNNLTSSSQVAVVLANWDFQNCGFKAFSCVDLSLFFEKKNTSNYRLPSNETVERWFTL